MELFSKAEEFTDIRFHGDKQILTDLNKHASIRYKLKKPAKVTAIHHKINILIQCLLGGVAFPEKQRTTLTNDTNMLLSSIHRVARGLLEMMVEGGGPVSIASCLSL